MGVASREHPATKRSAEEIQQWLVNYVARQSQESPDAIDVTLPFHDFALDSLTAVAMTSELESWLGRKVDPTLVFDYPTIEQFSQCLEQES